MSDILRISQYFRAKWCHCVPVHLELNPLWGSSASHNWKKAPLLIYGAFYRLLTQIFLFPKVYCSMQTNHRSACSKTTLLIKSDVHVQYISQERTARKVYRTMQRQDVYTLIYPCNHKKFSCIKYGSVKEWTV